MTLLQVEHLYKRFGGLIATDDCNLDIRTGEIHALIGPNGAGKTTLLAQLSGEMPADSGRIVFRDQDVSRWPIHRRVAAGMVRSYQITTVFRAFTVRENLELAVQARTGHSFDLLGTVSDESGLEREAYEAAQKVGLEDEFGRIVGTLSHGKQRALELGIALACKPVLLLLDEPLAGTDPEESKRMGALIHSLRGVHSIVLVEHDMDAVFRLADRVSVLVSGKVIASGSASEIRSNPDVIKAYLGDEGDEGDGDGDKGGER